MTEKGEETVDERIATLEALLERSMVRKVLEQRLTNTEGEAKKFERLFEREKAWSASLEERIEELEQALGVAIDFAKQEVESSPSATVKALTMIQMRLSEVLGDRGDGAFCPTCSQKRE